MFLPHARFAAGPPHVLNGGIIATLLDCHGVCTAMARAYDDEQRAIGSQPEIWYATTSMTVDYLRPTPIGEEVANCAPTWTAVEDRATDRRPACWTAPGRGPGAGDGDGRCACPRSGGTGSR